jgi:hypothetical protein
MNAKNRKYLISDIAKAHLLTKDEMWVDKLYADDALIEGELMEFVSRSEADQFVRKLKAKGVHTQVVALNSIRLGLPPVEEDYDHALSALCVSAGTCLRVLAKIIEHDPKKMLPLVADNYHDLVRSEKIVKAWVKHLNENGFDLP